MPKTTLQNLYQADFVLWVENTVDKLKARNYLDVDWENLTKEIEALAGRERRELAAASKYFLIKLDFQWSAKTVVVLRH